MMIQRFEQLPGNFFQTFFSISRNFIKFNLHAKFQINWTIQTEITGGGQNLSPPWPYPSAKSPACLGLIMLRWKENSSEIKIVLSI